MPVFKALYPDDGGRPLGYVCRVDPEVCKKVVRTRRGMVLHLWRRHKVRLQLEIDLRDALPLKEDLSWMDQ
jgi:hypothetical protein